MDKGTRAIVLATVAALTTGCSISKTVEPLPAVKVGKLCILDNPKVLMDGFKPEVEQQLRAMNYQTHTYTGARPPECSHHMEYTANWQWDMAMYLSYAEFRVYDANGIAGSATYSARNGGGRLDKFGPTAEKIRPLLTQLFASTTAAGDAVPAAMTPEAQDRVLAATDASREARLKELMRLKEQALITDEEYDSKRQAILDEI